MTRKNFDDNSPEPQDSFNTISLKWTRAKDHFVYDDKGNAYIDMTAGAFVTNSGHSNEFVKKGIEKALSNDLVYSYNYPTDIREESSSQILKMAGDPYKKVLHFSSGSEATTTAYLLMRQKGRKEGRKEVYFFKGNYHSRGVFGEWLKEEGLEEKPEHIKILDFPYEDSCKFSPDMIPNPEKVAGIFIETFQGWGAWMYPQSYLNDLVSFCHKHGIRVCFDEIQAGIYRMGSFFGFDTYQLPHKPDYVCLSKGLSSSLPHSALLLGESVADETSLNYQGTFSATPLVLSATLENLKFLEEYTQTEDFNDSLKTFQQRCQKLKEHKNVELVNAKGMVAGIIVDSKETGENIVRKCLSDGVLLVCTNKKSVKLGPPVTITSDSLNKSFDAIEKALKDV